MAGADEFFTLARDFGRSPAKVAKALFDVYKSSGEAFADDWRRNAVETSGEHGKLYPPTIDYDMNVALGIELEVGPNPALGKAALAGRGYEFGSENQPPHLDGARALPIMERRLQRATDLAIAYAIP